MMVNNGVNNRSSSIKWNHLEKKIFFLCLAPQLSRFVLHSSTWTHCMAAITYFFG